MPNEITIKVKVDDESKAGYASAIAEAKGFGDVLESELMSAGRKSGKSAGDEIAGGLNRQLRALKLPELDVHANADEARAKLAEIEAHVKALASDDMTIDVKIRTQKALSELNEFKRHFKEVEDDGNSNGKGWASKFLDSAKSSLLGLGGEASLKGVLTTGAIAMAPLIGASIAGAIVGGVGLGGIAGGFALAARDERVQFSILHLSDSLQEKLNGAVDEFVPTAVSSIDQISSHLNKINFKGIFADLAPQVAPLVNGVTDFIDRLSGAIEKLVKNSGPVIAAIGQEIGDLGSVLSRGLGMLSDNSEQEASALKDLFAIINGGIETVFMLVNALTEVYDVFHKMIEISPAGIYERITNDQRKVAGAAGEMAKALIVANQATDDQTTSTELAADALKRQDDALHQVAKSLKASTDPLFAFMDAQDSVTEKQKAMNQAISQHGRNSQQARAATKDYQKALIDYISSAAGATNGTGHLTAEQKRLLASAGASKQRINELDAALYDAWKKANKLDGFNVDIYYNQRFRTYGRPVSEGADQNASQWFHGMASGGVKGAASGPISSGLTWTGENGPELLDLPPGTTVHTSGDSARMARQMMGGGTGGPIQVILSFDKAGLTGLPLALSETIRAEVRAGGGNVQQYYGVAGA